MFEKQPQQFDQPPDQPPLKERHLAPATSLKEWIRNQIGKFISNKADFRVEGSENIENIKGGAIIVVAPHNGQIDTILTRMAFPPEFRKLLFAVAAADYWDDVAWKRLMGGFFVRIFPIDRGNADQSSYDLKKIAELLLNGERALIFPEGTRSRNPEQSIEDRRFKTGWAVLVLLTEGTIPVIPVYLNGNDDLMPVGSKLPGLTKDGEPKTVVVKIGRPIDFSSFVEEPVGEMNPESIVMARRSITSSVKAILELFEKPEVADDAVSELEPY